MSNKSKSTPKVSWLEIHFISRVVSLDSSWCARSHGSAKTFADWVLAFIIDCRDVQWVCFGKNKVSKTDVNNANISLTREKWKYFYVMPCTASFSIHFQIWVESALLGVANGKLLVSAGKMGYIQTELFKTSNDYQSAKDTSTIWVEQIFRDIYGKREEFPVKRF